MIPLFIFILSSLYIARYLFEFIFKLLQREPKQIKIDALDAVFLYLAISYFLTYLII
jgi:hypothetical protein